jgi:hypothetical protein
MSIGVKEDTVFGYKHYVPILKGKDGELRALACLTPNARRNITPFIDIPRRDLDIKTNLPKNPIDVSLRKRAKKIEKLWGKDRKIFVDVYDLSLGLRTPNGMHFLEYLFSQLRECNVQAIPVIGLDRSGDTDYLKAVRNTVSTDRRGVCIRLLCDDMEIPQDTYSDVDTLVRTLGLSKSGVHLLMDFRSIYGNDLNDAADIATTFLANLPNTTDWKTITLSSSGFPENLGLVSPRSVETLPRTELDLRDRLISRRRSIPRFPTFGDYGICHPDLLDFDPRIHTPSAAIRYTIEREWLIVKAGSIKKYKLTQFRDLSNTLRTRPEYYGIGYSWGDKYISECADYSVRNGNLTTWRQVGTNHHLTLVGNQIANSPSI